MRLAQCYLKVSSVFYLPVFSPKPELVNLQKVSFASSNLSSNNSNADFDREMRPEIEKG